MKRPFKCVIFDLDGTLLNTLEDIADTVNQVLAQTGLPVHSLDLYRYFVGNGIAPLVRRALPENKQDEHTVKAYTEKIISIYRVNYDKKTRPYKGIPELLNGLKKFGLKMAVLSNKPHEFTVNSVEKLLPAWVFDKILGQKPSIPKKPNPAGALEIAKGLKIDPSYFLYVGDTGIDMQTAIAAGMFPVGALWGFREANELLENGAKTLAEKPQDILNILRCGNSHYDNRNHF